MGNHKQILLLVLFSVIPVSLSAQAPVSIEEGRGKYLLGLQLEYLEDPSGTLEYKDVSNPAMEKRWQKSIWKVPNFAFTKSVYWLRLSLKNPLKDRKDMLLELANPLHDYLNVYIKDEGGSVSEFKGGDRRPLNVRKIIHRNFVYELPLAPGAGASVYLRFKSHDGFQEPMPLILWEGRTFSREDTRIVYFLGLLMGIVVVMTVYNLFIYFSLRDKSYLYYVLFLMGVALWLSIYHGFAALNFLKNHPTLANQGIPFTLSFSMLQLFLFMRFFLDTAKNAPRLDFLIKALSGLPLLIMVLAILNLYGLSILLIILATPIISIVSIAAGTVCLLGGHRPARYYLLAYFAYFLGLLPVILKIADLAPSNLFTENGMFIGLVLMVIMFSLGLADRISAMREENDAARENALRIQKQAAENLECKVEERTRELALANEQLQQMDHAKSRFFANISHEFRTPLTLILAPIESILKGDYGDSIKKTNAVFQAAFQNGLRLLRLINNLLDFSKIEVGRMQANKQKTNISELLDFYKSSVQSGAESKGLQIAFEDKTEGLFAYVDRDLMEKAVMNLLSNAFKFTSSGGEIRIMLEAAPEDMFLVTVMDTGIGVPEDKLESIFERFNQLEESSSREYEGTGIGLSLTKEIVELHGGTISVQSKPGQGAVFKILIPMGEPSQDVPDTEGNQEPEGESPEMLKAYLMADFAGPAQDAAPDETPLRHEHKVLIVDDNPSMRNFLKTLLERNYTVQIAGDGKQGLDRVREFLPDLILSDVMMPVMDGYEMTQNLKSHRDTRDIPVILLSAKADVVNRIEGLEFGADDYLPKPFNSGELMARIHNQIEGKKLERDLKNEKKERDQDFLQAALVQKTILTPQNFINTIHELEVDMAFLPMNSQVSGDYYNISRIDNGIASFFLADATGHGTQAALSTMQIDVLYKETLEEKKHPDQRFEHMNNRFIGELHSKNFFTGIIVDILQDKIRFSSAGHPDQFLIRPDNKQIQKLRTRGGIIGMLEDKTYEMKETEIKKGDILLFFTDGIFEVFNKDKDEFGEERLFSLIQEGLNNALFEKPMARVIEAIMTAVDDFRKGEPLGDDVTLIGVRVK